MTFPCLTRWLVPAALVCCVCGLASARGQHHNNPPAPVVRRPPPPVHQAPPAPAHQSPGPQQGFRQQPQAPPQPQQSNQPPAPHAGAPGTSPISGIQRHENPGQKPQNGEHLAGWLDHHSNLSQQQQQQALEKEPGFHDLPAQTQQRYRDRIAQLDSMPPEQRARIIQRNEQMEKLTPDQRNQVQGALKPLATLSQDRRRLVARTFRAVRNMPPAQRQAYMNSPEFRSQFSDQERGMLGNLMAAEPYIPKPE